MKGSLFRKYLMKLLSLRFPVSLERFLIQFSAKRHENSLYVQNVTVKVHMINTDMLRIFSLSKYFVSFFAFRVVIWPGIEILTMPFCSP